MDISGIGTDIFAGSARETGSRRLATKGSDLAAVGCRPATERQIRRHSDETDSNDDTSLDACTVPRADEESWDSQCSIFGGRVFLEPESYSMAADAADRHPSSTTHGFAYGYADVTAARRIQSVATTAVPESESERDDSTCNRGLSATPLERLDPERRARPNVAATSIFVEGKCEHNDDTCPHNLFAKPSKLFDSKTQQSPAHNAATSMSPKSRCEHNDNTCTHALFATSSKLLFPKRHGSATQAAESPRARQ
jgi:hypothetical protein